MQLSAGFSWSLTVDGSSQTYFGDMRISFDRGGVGSGVCSRQFEVTIPFTRASGFRGGAEVVLSGSGGSATFYISSAVEKNGNVELVCYDRALFLECVCPIDENAFENDEIDAGTVLDAIGEECGLPVFWSDGALLSALPKLPKDMVYQQKCRDILEDIAAACGGYFACRGDDGIYFYSVGQVDNLISESVSLHEKVKRNGSKSYMGLSMKGNGREFSTFDGLSGDPTVMYIDTELACKELFLAVSDKINNAETDAWECGRAELTRLIELPVKISFGSGEALIAGRCSMSIDSFGIHASLGADIPSESWEYKGKTDRETDKRIKSGELCKNAVLSTSGGMKFVYVNENS